MTQTWEHVLFAHWDVPAPDLRALLPPGIALDTWHGRALLGVLPFTMRGIRLRGTPAVPGLSAFHELNVRTYVTVGEHPGVFFFSLDATSALAVAVARRWFALPYHRAQIEMAVDDGNHVRYRSQRTHPGSPPAELDAAYGPVGATRTAERGSLEAFVAERYALFTTRGDGTVVRGDIHHAPWPLQPASARLTTNTMATPLGLELLGEPRLHYASSITAWIWPPRAVYRPVAVPRA